VEQLSYQNLSLEVDRTIDRLKRYETPGIGQIQIDMIHSGGKIVSSEIQKLINSFRYEDKFPPDFKESIILPVYSEP
jgi:hypothetical protein